jgi:hypothetical protein
MGEDGDVSEPAERTEVRLRRAPKLGVFLLLGAVVGALATLILTSLFQPDPAIGFAASFGYFLLFGAPAGAAVGALVGLIIDRVSLTRARTVTVEHEVVGEPGETPAPKTPAPKTPVAGKRAKRPRSAD